MESIDLSDVKNVQRMMSNTDGDIVGKLYSDISRIITEISTNMRSHGVVINYSPAFTELNMRPLTMNIYTVFIVGDQTTVFGVVNSVCENLANAGFKVIHSHEVMTLIITW